ncbi:MAG: hypothetical protein V1735_06855 [Nanoarchaeota archaeon]
MDKKRFNPRLYIYILVGLLLVAGAFILGGYLNAVNSAGQMYSSSTLGGSPIECGCNNPGGECSARNMGYGIWACLGCNNNNCWMSTK